MKKAITTRAGNILSNKFTRIRTGLMMAAGSLSGMAATMTVAGAIDKDAASGFIETIIELIGAAAIIGGIIIGIMGFVAYAEAKSEGEGPGMSKATNKIIGAIILLAVGIAIEIAAPDLAGLLSDIKIFSGGTTGGGANGGT